MDCQKAVELLPWYLNGTVDTAERAEVEGHLERCEACRAELAEAEAGQVLFGGHPSAAVLVDYAFEGSAVPTDLVEAHLAGCEACAEELAMVRASRREMDREPPAEVAAKVVPLRLPDERRSAWWPAAVAAALVGLIGIGGGLWSWSALQFERDSFARRERAAESRIAELEAELRGFDEARLNVPIHDLWPEGSVLRSADGEPPTLAADEGPAATLILNSELRSGERVERLEIRAGDDRLLQTLTGLDAVAGRSFTLSLPLSPLPRGKVRILLFAADDAEPVETYSFGLE